MRFLHASIYQQAFRDSVAQSSTSAATTPLPLIVACPECHEWYFAEHEPGAKPWRFEQVEWRARQVLASECPDHPHRFDVAEA